MRLKRQIAETMTCRIIPSGPYRHDHIDSEKHLLGLLEIRDLYEILSIIIDLEVWVHYSISENLRNLTLGMLDEGLVAHHDKTIYIAMGEKGSENERRLFYGLTLYVIHVVFNNHGKPCYSGNVASETRLYNIYQSIMQKHSESDWIAPLSKDPLLAMSQFLANMIGFIKDKDSINRLHAKYPEIMEYYENIFMPACINFTKNQHVWAEIIPYHGLFSIHPAREKEGTLTDLQESLLSGFVGLS